MSNPQSNPAGTVLVTGASIGIGYELARRFARDGYELARRFARDGHNLVLVARNKEKLESAAAEFKSEHGVDSRVITKDLSDPTAPAEIFRELEDASVDIRYLINNAGFGSLGPFHERPIDEQIGMIQVNVMALAHLTRLFLPRMVENKNGHVANIASVAAYQAGPFMATYYATKAFVVSFSEAIANELKGTGVYVTVINPGPTVTEFHKRAGVESSTLFSRRMTMDVTTVAQIAYDGIKAKKTVVTAGAKNKLLIFSTRLAPRSVTANVARSLNEPRMKRRND
jgi:short-subunit dehydrogenase